MLNPDIHIPSCFSPVRPSRLALLYSSTFDCQDKCYDCCDLTYIYTYRRLWLCCFTPVAQIFVLLLTIFSRGSNIEAPLVLHLIVIIFLIQIGIIFLQKLVLLDIHFSWHFILCQHGIAKPLYKFHLPQVLLFMTLIPSLTMLR